MRILFYIPSMIGGGAERVIANISSALSLRGHEIFVATNTALGTYDIDDNVKLISMYENRNGWKKIPVIRQLLILIRAKKILKKVNPDVVVGVMPIFYLLARIITIGTGIPIVASDHTSFRPNNLMRFHYIRHSLYRYADAVIILTQTDYDILGEKLPNKVVIPNPLSYNIITKEDFYSIQRNETLLAVGRLDVWYIKGFDILIQVWSKVTKHYPNWRLQIAGTGSSESISLIKKMIKDSNCEDSVELLGFQNEINKLMQKSSVFVLSSRNEGFPMGLVEAMSQGCACVAFSIGGAIDEIIKNDENGLIVKDGDKVGLQYAIESIISNKEKRTEISLNSIRDIEKYRADNIAVKWEILFNKLLK